MLISVVYRRENLRPTTDAIKDLIFTYSAIESELDSERISFLLKLLKTIVRQCFLQLPREELITDFLLRRVVKRYAFFLLFYRMFSKTIQKISHTI